MNSCSSSCAVRIARPLTCELRFHGESWGWEAQFYERGEFVIGRRFLTRAQAVQWAEEERKTTEKGGAWVDRSAQAPMIWLGELVGRGLMEWSSREGLRFVGAMLATGCSVAAVYRGSRWLVVTAGRWRRHARKFQRG